MKALSFRQPWAELVLQGRKTMDLRTYNTHYRGRILVHAAQTVEEAACRVHGLEPANMPAGGFVGTVEVVDVVELTEATYAASEAEHLAGRSYRKGMYGWILAEPQRFAAMMPAPGRTNLFTVDIVEDAQANAGQAHRAVQRPLLNKPNGRQAEYHTALDGVTPERPFALEVKPVEGSSTDFVLALRQRVVERPHAEPHILTVVTIGGDNLRAVADHVLDALRRAEYKVTDLSASRRKPFLLPEEIGVRLGLVFLTVKPLTKLQRVEAISSGIRQMPAEEAYYWYSKCTATETAERAQKALRVLLAAE